MKSIQDAYEIALEFGLKDSRDSEKRAYLNLLKQIARDAICETEQRVTNMTYDIKNRINDITVK